MAKKTSRKVVTKKVETLKAPRVVLTLRNFAIGLQSVSDLPETTVAQQKKLVISINKFADRVGKILASTGTMAEREAKKAERTAKTAERNAAKKVKAEKRIADLKAKLAKMEAALKS